MHESCIMNISKHGSINLKAAAHSSGVNQDPHVGWPLTDGASCQYIV